jgi:hypothetical protein
MTKKRKSVDSFPCPHIVGGLHSGGAAQLSLPVEERKLPFPTGLEAMQDISEVGSTAMA